MKNCFRKSVFFLISAVLILSVCLTGCTADEKGFPLPVSPTEKSAFEMCTTMYTDAQLNEIYDYMTEEKDVEKLDKKYELQCLRKTDDGYKVFYVSTKKFLILSFDPKAKFIEEERKACVRDLVQSVAPFYDLKVGDSVHKVQTVDQHSFIYFLAYPSSLTDNGEQGPLFSDHYTEDGYHVHIEYDEQENISSIDFEPA